MATACGSAPLALPAMDPVAEVRRLADQLAPHNGLIVLKRSIRGHIDARPDPGRAQSRLIFHTVLARPPTKIEERKIQVGVQVIPPPTPPETLPGTVHVLLPPGAGDLRVAARIIARDHSSVPVILTPVELPRDRAPAPAVDPGQRHVQLEGAHLRPDEVLEVVAATSVTGTLVLDGHWLGATEGPTAEFILRYDLPSHTTGAMQVVGHPGRPMKASRDGGTVFAFRADDLPRWRADSPHVRFVTRTADPRGFKQVWARSWRDVARPARLGLDDPTTRFRGQLAPPALDPGQAGQPWLAPWAWTRDRPQRQDAQEAHWREGRDLRAPLENNDLHATDKAHLLRWLLDEAGVASRFAVARGGRHARLAPDFPVPGAFHEALVFLPGPGIFLDPACQECAPGEVRPTLRGGQALVIDKVQAGPVDLPGKP